MNKKQALQNGYTLTGDSGTDWGDILAKGKIARNKEFHSRIVTEISRKDGVKELSYAVYTKPVKRAVRPSAVETAPTTATPVLTPPAATSEATAAVSVKSQKPKVTPKAKKEKGK